LIAEGTPAGAAFELAHHFGRESVGVERERLGEMDAGHFPMTRSGVLAGRRQGAFAISARGGGGGGDAGKRLDVAEAEARQVRQLETANARDVAQRVAAHGAILRGIGHFADTYAIENDPDDAGKRHNSTLTSVRGAPGAGLSGECSAA